MSAFIIVAALMAAIAATVVAVPLMRDKKTRLVGALAALLVAGAAAGLYPLWSNWDWHAPAQAQAIAAPEVAAMMAKLEQHLRDDPNDLAGWLMLGRSYTALQRLDDAVTAYDRAHQLAGNNSEAALGLGEALSLRAGGEITPPASQLFEDAITLEPNNPKALLYGGFAAATNSASGCPCRQKSCDLFFRQVGAIDARILFQNAHTIIEDNKVKIPVFVIKCGDRSVVAQVTLDHIAI